MVSVRTYKQAISYLKSLEGKAVNPDGAYGYQCFDVANQYWLYLFGHTLKGVGAADIPTWKDRKSTRLHSSHYPGSRMPSSA